MGPIEVFSEKLAKRSSVCYSNRSQPKATVEILAAAIKRNSPARSLLYGFGPEECVST